MYVHSMMNCYSYWLESLSVGASMKYLYATVAAAAMAIGTSHESQELQHAQLYQPLGSVSSTILNQIFNYL